LSSDFVSCVDLVSHYLAKAKEMVHNRKYEASVAKEEGFRNTLTLLILLQNPPGDIAAHVKEDVVDGFCEIFAFSRYQASSSFFLSCGSNLELTGQQCFRLCAS
jgi:hypothetical protein